MASLRDALTDEKLFGPWFRPAESWQAWLTFLAACFGLPMSEADLRTFRRHTGRQEPPTSPAREAWLVVGRRGGKSRIAAFLAIWFACFRDYSNVLAPGERGTFMVIAADRRQSRTVFRYIESMIDGIPALRAMVVRRTQDSIDLRNRVTIEVHTASFRAVRGYTLIGAVLDEVAFWRDTTSANPDEEVLAALRPGMATVPGAMIIAISSPYARRGVLWDAYRTHWGKSKSQVLVWQAGTRSMNPTVPLDVITRAYEADDAAARAEYGGEFRRDIEGFLSREVVEAATVPGRIELPPTPAVDSYSAFVDPSGGASDSMTLAIGHREEDRALVDAIREYRPPFSPESVVEEIADLLRLYRVSRVTGDRYGAEWVAERFEKAGIHYEPSPKPKSDLYRELLPALNSGRVEIPEHKKLAAQLVSLERRTARGGRDSIDHPPGGHDDVANAVAGVSFVLLRRRQVTWEDLYPPRPKSTEQPAA